MTSAKPRMEPYSRHVLSALFLPAGLRQHIERVGIAIESELRDLETVRRVTERRQHALDVILIHDEHQADGQAAKLLGHFLIADLVEAVVLLRLARFRGIEAAGEAPDSRGSGRSTARPTPYTE